jgi:hypothetical protein
VGKRGNVTQAWDALQVSVCARASNAFLMMRVFSQRHWARWPQKGNTQANVAAGGGGGPAKIRLKGGCRKVGQGLVANRPCPQNKRSCRQPSLIVPLGFWRIKDYEERDFGRTMNYTMRAWQKRRTSVSRLVWWAGGTSLNASGTGSQRLKASWVEDSWDGERKAKWLATLDEICKIEEEEEERGGLAVNFTQI